MDKRERGEPAAAVVLQTPAFRVGTRYYPDTPCGGDVAAVEAINPAIVAPVSGVARIESMPAGFSGRTLRIGGAVVQKGLLCAAEMVRGRVLWWGLTRSAIRFESGLFHIVLGFEGWGRCVAAVVPIRQPEVT